METRKSNIWVPQGFGDRQARAVRRAVKEYDPDLDFGRNELTGQWCIFIRQGASVAAQEVDLPVLGFDDIPHPDDALRRLHQSDAQRTGMEIINKLQKDNDLIEKRREVAAQEAVEETAEGFDWGFRQMGKAPYAKVFIPGK